MNRFDRFPLVSLALIVLLSLSNGQAEEKEGSIQLFNGKDLTGWTVFVDPRAKDADPKKIFTVQDGIIHCAGTPFGYLLTEKNYENYVLRLEWKWGEKFVGKNRNSGVFVHVSGPDKIWPKGVEAQLASGRAGDFWLVSGFALKVDKTRQDPKVERHYLRIKEGVEKPIGEWNQYEITCKEKTIKLAINGMEVNEGTDAESSKGKILLQSEGAEISFRNIGLTPIK